MLCMMSSTLWFVRPVLFSVLMIVCLCLVCSNRAGCECRGGSVFGGWVSLLQQVPKTNRGISGKWSLLCFSEKLLSTSGTKLRLLEDATPPLYSIFERKYLYIRRQSWTYFANSDQFFSVRLKGLTVPWKRRVQAGPGPQSNTPVKLAPRAVTTE